jgi:NNP family nitrate/nitrite transporter-like MFS transporter
MLKTLRAGHWPSLLGAWLHFEVSFMVWLLIGALGVPISEEFKLAPTQKGLLVAVPLLSGALLRVIVGMASDRVGPKRTGLAVLFGELIALVWGWLGAGSYTQVLEVGLCLGFAGASFAVALPVASRAYPSAHQGLAMGIAASANSGTVLAVFFAPRLAEVMGWHAVFGIMVLPVLATISLFALLVEEDHGGSRRGASENWIESLRKMLRQPSVYWLCFLYSVTFGGFVGLCSFLPIFLHDQYALDVVTAGSVAALCGLAGSLIRPVGGYVADRLNAQYILIVVFSGIALLALGLAPLPAILWSAPILVMMIALMGCGNGVIFRLVSERFRGQMGMASGLIGAAGGFGGFLLPSWLGLLKDVTGTYLSGFLLLSLLAAVGAVSVVMVVGRRRRAVSR